ncbi:MAG TPA: hypothetical protein VK524_04685 [Polyangiaceae bacterium]|nr:hypothetical protein [Polyangiaceae bacterium]
MARLVPNRPFSLKIVDPTAELLGVAPVVMERTAKLASVGDRSHRALIHVCTTLARYGVRACCPPGTLDPAFAALDTAESWTRDKADALAVRKARSDAFNAVIAAERRATDALRASLTVLPRKKKTQIDSHADATVVRYAGLAANFAYGAALLTCDAVDDPAKAALVPQQIAGALAYQAAGLGPARSSESRAGACEQAEWESEREGAPEGHSAGALAVMLFHEFLGAYWRQHSDAQRAYFDEFIVWALADAAN